MSTEIIDDEQAIQDDEIEQTAEQNGRSAIRPYSLQSFIEFVFGPAPTTGGAVLDTYTQRIQGMYRVYGMRKRVAVDPVTGVGTFDDVEVSRRQWIRKAHSGLTVIEADQLACAAGVHPSMIWKTWFEDAVSQIAHYSEVDWKRLEQLDARRQQNKAKAQRTEAAA